MGSSSKMVTIFYTMELLMLMQGIVLCHAKTYKVGDLDSWGVPTAANPDVYTKWSKNHLFRVGDSLLFLYPPSQDSLIQVTPSSYNNCNVKHPILYMNDGNSLFNITQPGEYYFTSAQSGHCQKNQKLHISIPGDGAVAYPPSDGPTAMADDSSAPSYHNAFGSIPTPNAAAIPTYWSPFLTAFLVVAASWFGFAKCLI